MRKQYVSKQYTRDNTQQALKATVNENAFNQALGQYAQSVFVQTLEASLNISELESWAQSAAQIKTELFAGLQSAATLDDMTSILNSCRNISSFKTFSAHLAVACGSFLEESFESLMIGGQQNRTASAESHSTTLSENTSAHLEFDDTTTSSSSSNNSSGYSSIEQGKASAYAFARNVLAALVKKAGFATNMLDASFFTALDNVVRNYSLNWSTLFAQTKTFLGDVNSEHNAYLDILMTQWHKTATPYDQALAFANLWRQDKSDDIQNQKSPIPNAKTSTAEASYGKLASLFPEIKAISMFGSGNGALLYREGSVSSSGATQSEEGNSSERWAVAYSTMAELLVAIKLPKEKFSLSVRDTYNIARFSKMFQEVVGRLLSQSPRLLSSEWSILLAVLTRSEKIDSANQLKPAFKDALQHIELSIELKDKIVESVKLTQLRQEIMSVPRQDNAIKEQLSSFLNLNKALAALIFDEMIRGQPNQQVLLVAFTAALKRENSRDIATIARRLEFLKERHGDFLLENLNTALKHIVDQGNGLKPQMIEAYCTLARPLNAKLDQYVLFVLDGGDPPSPTLQGRADRKEGGHQTDPLGFLLTCLHKINNEGDGQVQKQQLSRLMNLIVEWVLNNRISMDYKSLVKLFNEFKAIKWQDAITQLVNDSYKLGDILRGEQDAQSTRMAVVLASELEVLTASDLKQKMVGINKLVHLKETYSEQVKVFLGITQKTTLEEFWLLLLQAFGLSEDSFNQHPLDRVKFSEWSLFLAEINQPIVDGATDTILTYLMQEAGVGNVQELTRFISDKLQKQRITLLHLWSGFIAEAQVAKKDADAAALKKLADLYKVGGEPLTVQRVKDSFLPNHKQIRAQLSYDNTTIAHLEGSSLGLRSSLFGIVVNGKLVDKFSTVSFLLQQTQSDYAKLYAIVDGVLSCEGEQRVVAVFNDEKFTIKTVSAQDALEHTVLFNPLAMPSEKREDFLLNKLSFLILLALRLDCQAAQNLQELKDSYFDKLREFLLFKLRKPAFKKSLNLLKDGNKMSASLAILFQQPVTISKVNEADAANNEALELAHKSTATAVTPAYAAGRALKKTVNKALSSDTSSPVKGASPSVKALETIRESIKSYLQKHLFKFKERELKALDVHVELLLSRFDVDLFFRPEYEEKNSAVAVMFEDLGLKDGKILPLENFNRLRLLISLYLAAYRSELLLKAGNKADVALVHYVRAAKVAKSLVRIYPEKFNMHDGSGNFKALLNGKVEGTLSPTITPGILHLRRQKAHSSNQYLPEQEAALRQDCGVLEGIYVSLSQSSSRSSTKSDVVTAVKERIYKTGF